VVNRVQKGAAQSEDGERLSGGVERDVDRDFFAADEGEQIYVNQAAVPRLDLNAVHQNALLTFAVDFEFDDRVRVDRLADVIELVRVERNRDRFYAVAKDDRRDAAGFAQLRNALADRGSAGRVEYCSG
jgi:hypothetical protein